MTYTPPVQSYLLLNNTNAGPLTQYRVFTAGNNLFTTDGGAQSTLTVNVDVASSSTGATLTLTSTSNTSQFCGTGSNNITVNLPACSSNTSKVFQIMKTTSDANTVTVTPNGTDTINGSASYVLAASVQYNYVILQSDGTTNWKILGVYLPAAASYIVASLTGSPANARVLTAGNNASVVDGGAQGSITVNVELETTISAVTTLTNTSNTNISCTGTSYAVTLPAASNTPKKFTIVNSGSGTITVTCAGTDTIAYNGTTASTYALSINTQSVTILAIGGGSWVVL